ncbi:MAG: cysteine desulfurase [Lachnospiraceae bacterium]|nr:cysteine desulfurase [Lachnospiraceae bacterium]
MEIYLDNSATTKCFPEVAQTVAYMMQEEYGNPSSMHTKGIKAENAVRKASEIIADTLKVNSKDILYTSGGTESDNLAIIGTAMANYRSGRHIITTAIEHPAVLQCMKYLAAEGFEITYLGTDSTGRISLEELSRSIRPDTILVSIMAVNNEIGSIQPIDQAGDLIKKKNPNTIFHVDAVQGYGKIPIYPKRWKIDLLSVSGHKIHGPKGVGFLYINEKVKIKPIILGGGQQKNLRSGTENTVGVAGIGKAAELVFRNIEEDIERMYALRSYFINGLKELEGVTVNGAPERYGAPHVVSVSVAGVQKAESLLHALEERGIYVSAGSACASNKPAISATLQAIGLPKELLGSTIRFSFSVFTTKEELDITLDALKEIIPEMRKFRRR